MKIVFIDPNLSGMTSQNVGLAYVISAVESKHRVRLLDLTFHPEGHEKYILRQLETEKPDIVGLSVTSFSFQVSLQISELIKKNYPAMRIIWGGGYPTLFPEESIGSSWVDAICIGEGERSTLEYLNSLENNRELNIEGIWSKDVRGRICKNRLRPFEENIDLLAFPNWEHWNIEKHLQKNLYFVPGAIKLLASRGCPYNCSFCSNEAMRSALPGKYYRTRTPQNIIQEIKLNEAKYWTKGFRTIHFADEIFGLSFEFLQDFCRLFKQEGLDRKFSWCCATRADIISQDWARLAADSGCAWVWLGIESADEHIRNGVYGKNISQEQISKAVMHLNDNGVAYNFSLMIGCPEDTKESIERSIKMIKTLKPTTFDVSFYQPLPRTKLGDRVLQTREVSPITSMKHSHRPRMRTQTLSVTGLNSLMWKIRLTKFLRFLSLGWVTKKFVFILDIFKYIFSVKGCRAVTLTNPIIGMDIQLKTIFKYVLEAKRAAFKNNL